LTKAESFLHLHNLRNWPICPKTYFVQKKIFRRTFGEPYALTPCPLNPSVHGPMLIQSVFEGITDGRLVKTCESLYSSSSPYSLLQNLQTQLIAYAYIEKLMSVIKGDINIQSLGHRSTINNSQREY